MINNLMWFDGLRCSITGEFFTSPVTTNCGHTFEQTALDSWLKNNKFCPICRTEVTCKVESFCIKQLLEFIPKNISEEQNSKLKQENKPSKEIELLEEENEKLKKEISNYENLSEQFMKSSDNQKDSLYNKIEELTKTIKILNKENTDLKKQISDYENISDQLVENFNKQKDSLYNKIEELIEKNTKLENEIKKINNK